MAEQPISFNQTFQEYLNSLFQGGGQQGQGPYAQGGPGGGHAPFLVPPNQRPPVQGTDAPPSGPPNVSSNGTQQLSVGGFTLPYTPYQPWQTGITGPTVQAGGFRLPYTESNTQRTLQNLDQLSPFYGGDPRQYYQNKMFRTQPGETLPQGGANLVGPQAPAQNGPFATPSSGNYPGPVAPNQGFQTPTSGNYPQAGVPNQTTPGQAPGTAPNQVGGDTSYEGAADKYYGPSVTFNGTGGGTGGGTGTGVGKSDKWGNIDPVTKKYIDYSYDKYDTMFGQGWTDTFMQNNGLDPISFYKRAFLNDPRAAGWQLPGEMGQQGRDFIENMADYAATSQGKFLPGAINEWRKVHGNADIPPEMWDKWWSISLSTGGDPMHTGVGENPYGVV